MNSKALKWINTCALITMLLYNFVVDLIPLGGRTTAQISQAYPSLFTPAPITFIIWGLIYLLLIGFVLYQWEIFDGGRYSQAVREKTGIWFAVSCTFNILWLTFWHFDLLGLALITILALTGSLVLIEMLLKRVELNPFGKLMVTAGFDIYLGWTIAASIANLATWLRKLGWNGLGLPSAFWTIVALFFGASIGIMLMLAGRKWLSTLTIIWAYIGILTRHITPAPEGLSSQYVGIIIVALVCIFMMAFVILMPLCHCRPQKCKAEPSPDDTPAEEPGETQT